ncbi:MAG: outer membrane protein assembly factor BamA [Pseudomonadota bacterium]|nr:outer membrane protein assembly factor BamA [Pseudomonadota bacterium]
MPFLSPNDVTREEFIDSSRAYTLHLAQCIRFVYQFVLIVLMCIYCTFALGQQIRDIRIEGLQRVTAESVFSVLPFAIGDSITTSDTANLTRAIFSTGNFQNIEVGVDGDILILKLEERPSISEINIEGNKAIQTDALLEGLEAQGMAEGRVFRRATLEGMRRELARQYGSQGRYDAEITTDIVAKPRNRVAVDILIDEGSVAKIAQINVVGNKDYSDQQILDLMELKDRGLLNSIRGKKKYSREKLSGDLETINDFYLNRGYIQFRLKAAQVSVDPNKDSVYVTVNIDEGEQYIVNEVELAGDVKDQADTLERVFLLPKGAIFSQALVTRTEEIMKRVMGNEGYTFAEINSRPKVNEENKTVDVTFFVEPGKRTYVRRIEFKGNYKTADEVLRREMRQLEGGLASTELIELSRKRLERLGFFKEAKVETPAVPGVDDLIDVNFEVEEQSSGSISASLGYSQDVGMIFGADFQQNNFLGTGKQVGIQANRSRFRTTYGFNYMNPYYTEDGVSRGFSVFFSETNFEEINVSRYSTNRVGGTVSFGYPINETQSLRFSAGLTQTEIEYGPNVAQEIKRTPDPGSFSYFGAYGPIYPFVLMNPDSYNNELVEQYINSPVNYDDPGCDFLCRSTEGNFDFDTKGFIDRHGDKFTALTFNGSWRESTLNRGILPDRGRSNSLSIEFTLPGSDLEYYKLTYDGQYFIPIGAFTLRLRSELGYGDGYGDTEHLPFFEHYLAGGFGSVRGFESNSLGPVSSDSSLFEPKTVQYSPGTFIDVYQVCDPSLINASYIYCGDGELAIRDQQGIYNYKQSFGGDILFQGGVELIFPLPFLEDQRSVRSVLYYDFGNVFSSHCNPSQTKTNCSSFDISELRSSVGIAITWLSGFGPLSFSFGKPIEYGPYDERESFQFSLGRTF